MAEEEEETDFTDFCALVSSEMSMPRLAAVATAASLDSPVVPWGASPLRTDEFESLLEEQSEPASEPGRPEDGFVDSDPSMVEPSLPSSSSSSSPSHRIFSQKPNSDTSAKAAVFTFASFPLLKVRTK